MTIDDYINTQLQPGEELITTARRHAILMVPAILLGALIILMDFFLLAWWFKHDWWGTLGFFLLILIGAVIVGRVIYLRHMNIFVLTSKRVIDIDQRGLFERHVAEAPLEKIQDVRYIIKGLWATIFTFGTVIVQTAGNTNDIDAVGIHHPVDLQRRITDTQQENGAKDALPPSHVVDIRSSIHES